MEAIAKLESADLQASVTETPLPDVEPGVVAAQNPKGGSKVAPGKTVTLTVSVEGAADEPPVPAISGPTEAEVGKDAKFDGSDSTDDGKVVTYYWEFGDGASASGKKAKHAWGSPGTFEVTLWVTDDAGAQASLTQQVLSASARRGRSAPW